MRFLRRALPKRGVRGAAGVLERHGRLRDLHARRLPFSGARAHHRARVSRVKLALRITSLVLAGVIIFLAGWRVAMRRGAAARVFDGGSAGVQGDAADYGPVENFSLVDQSSRTVTLA